MLYNEVDLSLSQRTLILEYIRVNHLEKQEYLKSELESLRKIESIWCPNCEEAIPINDRYCVNCNVKVGTFIPTVDELNIKVLEH